MNQENSLFFVSYMGLGFFCGFFGSMSVFLEWLVAPIFGFLFFTALKSIKFKPFNDGLVVIATSLGIFLGGLPVWLLIISQLFKSNWIKLVVISVTPILFLGGIGLAIIFSWVCFQLEKIRTMAP